MYSPEDHAMMQHALKLAEKAMFTTDPNPRVGCVICQDESIVGEGWHQQHGGPHAEVFALQQAGEKARGATAYITLEPCGHHGKTPPCSEALIRAGIRKVYAAMEDPNPLVAGSGLEQLKKAGIEVNCGLMQEQAEELNPGFISRHRRKRPWLRLKMAQSLDGRTALANGNSEWISCPAARQDVQQWRARSSAILTGAGTVVKDNPCLNVRLENTIRQPMIVVVDAENELTPQARLFEHRASVLHVSGRKPTCGYPENYRHLELEFKQGAADMETLMIKLAELSVNEVHTECGGRLAGSLLHAGLVDEMLLYVAPNMLGDKAFPTAVLPAFSNMQERPEFRWHDIRKTGETLRLLLRPVEGESV